MTKAPSAPQGLSEAAGSPITISFTPHLMPFSRGMEADIYVKLAGGATADSLREALAEQYADEPFVSILPKVLNEAWRAADCSCRSLPTTLR